MQPEHHTRTDNRNIMKNGISVQQVAKITGLGKDRRMSAIAHYTEQTVDLLVPPVS